MKHKMTPALAKSIRSSLMVSEDGINLADVEAALTAAGFEDPGFKVMTLISEWHDAGYTSNALWLGKQCADELYWARKEITQVKAAVRTLLDFAGDLT